MNTIWEILGIEPTLDKKEIRKAYAALSRTYHMEEFPEEFARIQQAYHAALEYAQHQRGKAAQFMHVVPSDSIENGRNHTPNSILLRLEQFRQNQKVTSVAYNSEEVIVQIIQLLTGCNQLTDLEKKESDRLLVWQNFILSDAFLTVYDREGFVEKLVQELSACREISLSELEPEFLSELSLVYGIIHFDDIGRYDRGNKVVLGDLLLEQKSADWMEVRSTAQRVSLSYSFYSFRKLCQSAYIGEIKDYQLDKWGNLCFHAEDNYIPKVTAEEAPKWQLRIEAVIEPFAPACVAMHRYLVGHYGISEQVYHCMRTNFEIDGRMGEYSLCSYQEAYEQMCQKYPHMNQSEAAKLTEWKLALLSNSAVFTKRALDFETIEWLMLVWKVRQCSAELTQEVYDAYKDEGAIALPLLEMLIGRLVDCKNELLYNCGAEIERVSLQNRCFWYYFLGTVYPYTNNGQSWRESDYHFALSQYMKQVYPVSKYFIRLFFLKETQSPKDSMHYVLQVGRQEKTVFLGEKEIRVVFTLHHVEYFIQGMPVFYQILSFAELAALPESEEGNVTFFLLLPITKIQSEEQCRTEVLQRFKYLPFYKPTWNFLVDCIMRNTDWEVAPEHPQKQLEEVYFSEDSLHCFRGRLTGRKFTVEYKTPKGWYAMKLLHGESKNTRAVEDKTERLCLMHKIVDGFLPPEPKLIKEISVKGKTTQQKADAVYRMILESRRILGIEFSVVLWFWEGEAAIPRLCYLFMEDYWDAANTLLEITGERKNIYLNREERLKRIIGEPAKIVGYFSVEDTLPFPVGIGKSGRFYSYFNHKLIVAECYPELIAQCVNLEHLYKIEIDDGLRSVDVFTRKLENWYMSRYLQETKEVVSNYPFEVFRELFKEL